MDISYILDTLTASTLDEAAEFAEYIMDECMKMDLDDDEYDPVPIIRDNGTGIKAPTVTRLYIPP